jgi:hypothetical protein
MELLAVGNSSKGVATALGLTVSTVKSHSPRYPRPLRDRPGVATLSGKCFAALLG